MVPPRPPSRHLREPDRVHLANARRRGPCPEDRHCPAPARATDPLTDPVGYCYPGRALTGGTAGDVLRAYGTVSGAWRLALLGLFTRTPPRPADTGRHRGINRGPGRRRRQPLPQEVAALAAEHCRRETRLDVFDVNPRARTLYERHGYRLVHTEHAPWLRDLLRFGSVTTKRRTLHVPERPTTS
ncbi:hypothetical protein GCM10010207_86330 [Streptomyces atratus]|nr:hypothetical protein GCM10010207_86330 [Streptomyces atratus]